MDNKIDEKAFQRRLFIRERRNQRVRETRNILETFRSLVVDRLNGMVGRCTNGSVKERRIVVEFTLGDVNSIISFCNESIRENFAVIGCSNGPLLIPGQVFKANTSFLDAQ